MATKKMISERRIPTHDILGQKVWIGERVILFARHGISYAGEVVQRGGKRWVKVNDRMFIGGIGNHFMIKEQVNEPINT